MSIPVIDIFAGPGGLGEGFSSLFTPESDRIFKIVLSIEKEKYEHQTLTLRSFYRQFNPENVPDEYYQFVRGEITAKELNSKFPKEAKKAKREAWRATLGEGEKATPNSRIDTRIREALNGTQNWLLVGGPPCQAYSVVGRSRRQQRILDEASDVRVSLYKQYLRILAIHNPSVFVMENVKGLLSAKTDESPVFSRILDDLSNPVKAYRSENGQNGIQLECPGYKIYSLVRKPNSTDGYHNPVYSHKDFVIKAEEYGIPQCRHRVILLGIRNDMEQTPEILEERSKVSIAEVLHDLPRLRSAISKRDSDERWKEELALDKFANYIDETEDDVRKEMEKQMRKIRIPHKKSGANFISTSGQTCNYESNWFGDPRLGGVLNHSSKGHMVSDLHRYLFVSSFGRAKKVSPKLDDFPENLLPNHKNAKGQKSKKKFADRFRVQLWREPAKTITSHISKDGHYYIHPDPSQCRSLTVREAARIQTFPDNYFFCGPKTSQFLQVGNAVPPMLAHRIAKVVLKVLKLNSIKTTNHKLEKQVQ